MHEMSHTQPPTLHILCLLSAGGLLKIIAKTDVVRKKTEGICSSTVKLLTRLSFEIHSLSFALCFVNIRKISHSTQDIPCWKMEPQGRQCLFHHWFQGKKKNPAHAEGQERESEPSTFFIRTYQSDTKAFTCKLPCILEHIMHAKPDNLSWI